MNTLGRALLRLVILVLLSVLALQAYFLVRIALMRYVDPQSTSFQRSEAGRLLATQGKILWSQQWVPYAQISEHLKRAVITSEDAGFADHSGIEWDALEQAFERNQRAQERAERINRAGEEAAGPRAARQAQTGGRLDDHPAAGEKPVPQR
jgi:monofunctional biosynthetic peptidoglycan transglycosylase